MIIITTDAELKAAKLPPELRTLLNQRRTMLDEYGLPLEEIAKFIVAQAADTLADIQTQLDMDTFEWVQDHGFAYEAPTIVSDDGYAVVLFADKSGIDPVLCQLLDSGSEADGVSYNDREQK